MKILPAMDLIDGKCVRLYQGDFNQTTQVGSDPESQLKTLSKTERKSSILLI